MKTYVYKDKHKYYRVSVAFNEKVIVLGTFKEQKRAEEVRKIFENECGFDINKFKALNLEEDEYKTEHAAKGNVYLQNKGTFRAQIYYHGRHYNLGTFNNEELAREALAYFIKLKYDYSKYCESDYWQKLRNTYKKNNRTKEK